MAQKKLSEILGSKSKVDLEFVDMIADETSDGQQLVKLVLKNPIPVVFGGKRVDRTSGDTYTLEASDVEMVTINPEALAELDTQIEAGAEPFTWEVEGKSGRLVCNLKMDVSNNLEAWIVKTTFGAFAQKQRQERNTKRSGNLQQKVAEAKAKRQLAGADVSAAPKAETVAEKE